MSISRQGSYSNGGGSHESGRKQRKLLSFMFISRQPPHFLHGEKAKSEGILTNLKQFIGIDLSVKSDECSTYLCHSCAKKTLNVVSKIKELKSLVEESEQVWKCTERIKRGCKNEESSPQSYLVKKPMTLTPPKSKLSLTSRFQPIAPKAMATTADITLQTTSLTTQTTKDRVVPNYLLPPKQRTEGAKVLASFGLEQAKVSF